MFDVDEIAGRFCGGPTAIALTCREVREQTAPILCVTRKSHVWQFLCGKDHSGDHVRPGDPDVVTVLDVVARDPSVGPVATLNERHYVLRRSVSDPWVPHDDLSSWWF
jgi:hypothetical protein